MAYDMGDYVDVATRLAMFRDKYPDGRLRPADPVEPIKIITIGDRVYLQYIACAYRAEDDHAPAIGIAWEPFPGRTPYTKDSEAMNAETSAWGRAVVAALAAEGKIASANEIQNRAEDRQPPGPPPRAQALARLWEITRRLEPELRDEDRQRWLQGETQDRGLDGSKTEDLIKLADQLEQEATS